MIEEYKKYLISISKSIKSDIYSHHNTVELLTNSEAFGYNLSDEDMKMSMYKAYVIIKTWSKEPYGVEVNVDSYEEFIANHRDNKLNEIGI